MTGVSPLMTADELVGYHLPGKRLELVRGRMRVLEPASFEHGDIMLRIGMTLPQFARATTPQLSMASIFELRKHRKRVDQVLATFLA